VVRNRQFGFFNHGGGQAITANHDYWTEAMGVSFERFALCGCNGKCCHGLDDRALGYVKRVFRLHKRADEDLLRQFFLP
jgi:hypothetical protein